MLGTPFWIQGCGSVENPRSEGMFSLFSSGQVAATEQAGNGCKDEGSRQRLRNRIRWRGAHDCLGERHVVEAKSADVEGVREIFAIYCRTGLRRIERGFGGLRPEGFFWKLRVCS